MPKKLLGQESLELRNGGELVETDAQMFDAANASGTGHMTFEEFAKYSGAGVEDEYLIAKFHL